jgi:hypothetical protein
MSATTVDGLLHKHIDALRGLIAGCSEACVEEAEPTLLRGVEAAGVTANEL